jgi:hypothetical protein
MDRITCVCLLGVVSFITAVPNSALAKPKQLVNGCSFEQIQSNFGNSCVDQMQQDLINNRSYTHALLCNGSEMLCCTYDNATNQVQTCRKQAGSRLMPGMRDPSITTSGIKSRGTEGAESSDEEVPAPAWMTEERMKQLQKDSQGK